MSGLLELTYQVYWRRSAGSARKAWAPGYGNEDEHEHEHANRG